MIGWSTVAPALVSVMNAIAVDAALDASGFTAEWKHGQRGFTHDVQGFSLLMEVTSVVGIGEDETRYVRNESDEPVETICGNRRIVMQLTAIVPDRTDAMLAHVVLDRVRTRLMKRSSIAALIAVGVALGPVGPALKTPFKDKGRSVNAAVCSVTFQSVVNDADTVEAGWFNRVEVSSQLRNEAGDLLDSPSLQMVDEVIGPA